MTDPLRRLGRWLARAWRDLTFLARVVVVLLLLVVLVPLGVVGWYQLTHCGPGIRKDGEQCIGITDGTDGAVFGTPTASALRAIGEENRRLEVDTSGTPVVSVAYLVPIPPPGVDDSYAARLRGDLLGAAVAQRQANRTNTIGDRPLIRLLVVNIGDSAEPSTRTARELIEMAGTGFARDRLMAVIVTGKSLDPLTEVIDSFVAAQVPVVVSHLTADRLTSTPVSPDTSLARVAPTTADESAAAAAYLRASTSRALIIQNTDPEDRYAQSLGAAFRARYPDTGHAIVSPDETYNARRDGAANAMRGIVRNICQQRPDAVFFAGRAPELAALVAALPTRPCLDLPVRVVTGDDGAQFAGSAEPPRGLRANASVEYTALAHPEAWRAAPEAFVAASTDFLTLTGRCAECFPTLFPGETLDDSYAIMAYDAVLTAVSGIRSPAGPVRSPGALIQEFKRFHGAGSIPGASGWISLAPTGDTINKAVPILRVDPNGGARFVQLSSPSGTPCIPSKTDC